MNKKKNISFGFHNIQLTIVLFTLFNRHHLNTFYGLLHSNTVKAHLQVINFDHQKKLIFKARHKLKEVVLKK